MDGKSSHELLLEAASHLREVAAYLTSCSNYFKHYPQTTEIAHEMHKNGQVAREFGNRLAVHARKQSAAVTVPE